MNSKHYDVIVVGAGFAGLYMIHRLRKQGMRVRVLEAADDVGGTWYWNRYPGARCDVESLENSFSFDEALQQEWVWSERYAAQPEILKYMQHVAERFDLRRDIEFNSRVSDAAFDPSSNTWTVTAENEKQFTARFLVMASGCLSNAKVPDVSGLSSFKGRWFHSGFWPRDDIDFSVTITGPDSPSVLSNVVVPVAKYPEWICNCFSYMRKAGLNRIKAQAQAQDEWEQHVDDVSHRSLIPFTNSWYIGANIPGKPRMFMPYMGGVGVYRRKCDGISSAGYTGFSFSRPAIAQAA
jgi:hypothetical protein